VPPSATAAVAVHHCVMKKNTKATPLDGLSLRERQVLKLVVEGRTSKEIAAIVGVKPSSVYTYRSRIMAKLEINDLPNLVRIAIRHGLIKA
jgi:DNA-binding CsgD family transcriptional regulator